MSLSVVNQLLTVLSINSKDNGNVVLLILLPIILKFIENNLKNLPTFNYKKLMTYSPFYVRPYTRTIEYNTKNSGYGEVVTYKQDIRNIIMHKSILMNIKDNFSQKYKECKIRLISIKDAGKNDDKFNYNNYSITEIPPNNVWIRINSLVELMYTTSTITVQVKDRSETEVKTSIIFRSFSKNGHLIINDFIKDSYDWYVSQTQSLLNDNRTFLYCIDNNVEDKSKKYHKRYLLSNEKTFDNLFIEDKGGILQLLDHFVNKTGKYKIKGFPYKLGMLLYGIPGSGKTSLIKAVAGYTKRNIINLSLSKIKTNQQLMEAVFDGKYNIQGIDLPITLDFSRTIFVIEDIDCISTIVNSRKDEEVEIVEKEEIKDKKDLLLEALITPCSEKREDKLDLSGILNVMDGIIDSPGRIIIITTNYPERLDEALIRPGRIDRKIHMGYIKYKEGIDMIRHYYDCLDSELLDIEDTVFDKNITPAELEQMCMEYDNINDLNNAFGIIV